MAVVYHWKHGWIPLDHTAALSKAKGNHEAANHMLADAPSAKGITSRQHVAKAALDLPNLTRTEDRTQAMHQLRGAAAEHGATDIVPPGILLRHDEKSTDPEVVRHNVSMIRQHAENEAAFRQRQTAKLQRLRDKRNGTNK